MELEQKEYTSLPPSTFNEKERSITHYISTSTVDEYNDIVVPSGMDDTTFRAVLWNHSYGINWLNDMTPPPSELVIGTSAWRKPDDRGVLAKTIFMDTVLGNDVMRFNAEGAINAWSIGYKTVEKLTNEDSDIRTILKWKLYEYSSVIFPANPDAENLMMKTAASPVLQKSIRAGASINLLKFRVEKYEKDFSELKNLYDELKTKGTGTDLKPLSDKINEMETKLQNRVEIAAVQSKYKLTSQDVLAAFGGAISKVFGVKFKNIN